MSFVWVIYIQMYVCLWVCHVFRNVLGCQCYSEDVETIEGSSHRAKERPNKTHWTAGRLGDIDFTGSSKTRGKVC